MAPETCQISISEEDPALSIRADIHLPDHAFQIFIRANQPVLAPNPEAFLAGALLPAMVSGAGEISLPGSLPAQLPEQFFLIQAIYSTWNENFKQVSLKNSSTADRPKPKQDRVALFYSGGVDSLYTLDQNHDKITDLIYIQGQDVPLQNQAFNQRLMPHITAVADHYDKNLIVVDTNLRDMLDRYASFGQWGFSNVLTFVGLSLFPSFSAIWASLDFSPGIQATCGSLLMPLWNHSGFSFRQADTIVFRQDKVAALKNSEAARNASPGVPQATRDFAQLLPM